MQFNPIIHYKGAKRENYDRGKNNKLFEQTICWWYPL